MRPHASSKSSSQLALNLKSFAITKNAFLPEHSPCKALSNAYYQAWEAVALSLPALLATGELRTAIRSLPILSVDFLQSEAEWRRAYVILGFMMHGYIWGGDHPEEVLPPQITVPLLQVSNHLELPPVLTYAAASLWNFSSDQDDFSDLESIETLFTFTGTESESWFFLISVAIESKAASAIPVMLLALDAVKEKDFATITQALWQLRTCIQDLHGLLQRMYERCDPTVFYHKIRPFLAGSKNMEAAGLPRGIFYDEGGERGEWRSLRGGSNGQSSLIQFFDIVLGVDHSTPIPGQKSFHQEAREYMPGPHRRFLSYVELLGSIQKLAVAAKLSPDPFQMQLCEAYTAATEALATFRSEHMQIVTRYIILPARSAARGVGSKRLDVEKRPQNLASLTISAHEGSQKLRGTGGTMLVPFLRKARDVTIEAGRLDKKAGVVLLSGQRWFYGLFLLAMPCFFVLLLTPQHLPLLQ
ncbi:hypothetical protein S40293_03639 [Stachybotrys chartarum IBT 40293]|nr:hypothetical protein S40293_03639 [Stachybotrys chartarum IBT 40293]